MKTPVNLVSDQSGVCQEFQNVPPYEFVEIILSNGAAGAQATVLVAVVVGAEAPIIVQLSLTRAGRRSVIAIATTRTCHEAL